MYNDSVQFLSNLEILQPHAFLPLFVSGRVLSQAQINAGVSLGVVGCGNSRKNEMVRDATRISVHKTNFRSKFFFPVDTVTVKRLKTVVP